MSDRDLNINIRTTADTSGATQAAASLDRIRESGESISQTSRGFPFPCQNGR